MKKILALVLVVVMLVSCTAVFASCGKATPTANPTDGEQLVKVKVAHHKGYSGAAVAAIGTKMGYFEEEGLDVELVPFTSGPPEIAAMASGEIQFGYIGSGATTLAVKGDVEIIYFQNLGDAEAVIVNKESGITSIEDLKGKTLATTLGTSGENIVNLALAKAGIEKGSGADQVNVINMDMGGCVTAMIGGQVDAVCVWGSYRVTLRDQLADNYLELTKTSDYADEYASVSSWLTTQEYIDANPEVVQHFANALAKCTNYWKANEKQTAAWVAELVDSDVPTIEKQIGTTMFLNAEELKAALEDGTIRNYYEVQQSCMLKDGKIEAAVPIDEYVKWEYMNKAVK